MKAELRWAMVSVLTFAMFLSTSCQSDKEASRPSTASAPKISVRNKAIADYSQPYLSDDKMERFLASMKEEHNPLELMFKPGGQMQDPSSMSGRIDEFNTFARKYGFEDYQDYTAVWGRITVAQMRTMGEQTFRDMISGAQKELAKPGLDPGMHKIYQDEIVSAQKGLDNLKNPTSRSALNSADFELIQKYKPQIEAAQKKYQAAS